MSNKQQMENQPPAEQLRYISALLFALQLLAERNMTQHVLLLFISHQLLLLWFQTDAAAPSVFRHPQRASTEIGTFDKTFEA